MCSTVMPPALGWSSRAGLWGSSAESADNDQGENALHKLAQNGFFGQVSDIRYSDTKLAFTASSWWMIACSVERNRCGNDDVSALDQRHMSLFLMYDTQLASLMIQVDEQLFGIQERQIKKGNSLTM